MSNIGKKITVGIYVDEQIVKKAKELGLNISKLCENCLKEAIRRMTEAKTSKNFSDNIFCSQNSYQVVDGAGFEPATSTMPTWRSFQADLPAHYALFLKL